MPLTSSSELTDPDCEREAADDAADKAAGEAAEEAPEATENAFEEPGRAAADGQVVDVGDEDLQRAADQRRLAELRTGRERDGERDAARLRGAPLDVFQRTPGVAQLG